MKKDLGACALRAGCSLAVSHSPMIFLTCSETVQQYPQNGSKRFCAPKIAEWEEENEGRSGEREEAERRKRRGQYSPQLRGGTRRQLNSRDINKFDIEYQKLVASQPKVVKD